MRSNNRKKIYRYFLNIDLYIAITAATLLIAIAFIGVFCRYLFNRPLVWGEEAQLACIVWVMFFGASAGIRTKGHAVVDVFIEHVNPSVRKIIDWIVFFIELLVLIYLLKNGYALFLQMINMHRKTPTLYIPYSAIYVAMPVSLVLMIINLVGMRFWPSVFSETTDKEDTNK